MRTSVLGLLLACALAPSTSAVAQTAAADPDSARIVTDDVERFWRAYDRLGTASTREDSARVLAEGYLAPATPALAAFAERRLGGPDALLSALGLLPRYYAAVRENTLRLREHEPALREGLRRLEALYPEATFPDITFVISGFAVQGTVVDGGLLIGAEMVSADAATPPDELPPFVRDVDLTAGVLPCIVVHELVHHQQAYEGDGTLLAQAIVEGVADFLAVQTVGCSQSSAATYTYGEANEAALWAEFRVAMHETDFAGWLYNGNEGGERPDNLGYWMGYQIAEAYYERAEDKRQAVYDMLHVGDFGGFLDASGYAERFEE